MSFEDLPCVLLSLEAVLPQSGLWMETGRKCLRCRAKDCGFPQSQRATHPAAQVHLEDGAIGASTEYVVLGQVHGHRCDAHVKQDRQQQVS